jgi:surface polysaccharide O-acyltransferase-like enzyme
MTSRMVWMDSLRGIAIVLVLFWHAPAIPARFGLDMPVWVEVVNNAFLPFRMPTLMFLSGLLLVRSLEKPLPQYYLGKIQYILWPYLLWAALHNLTFEAVAPLWHPRAWIATGYLWFLFFILVYYLVAPLIRWIPPYLTPLLCFVGAFFVDNYLFDRMLYFGGFFFAGYLAARYRTTFDRIARNGVVAAVSGAGAVLLGLWSTAHDTQYRPEYALLSLGGIIAAVYVTSKAGDAAWTRPLQFVGRSSIVYYVSHFPIMHVALIGLLAVGAAESAVVAPVLFLIALAVGTVLALGKKSPWISWMFEAPIPKAWTRASARTSRAPQ